MSTQFNLEKIEVSKLPELQGWKEKQLAIVKENPFVKIVDNKTYEEAKKARTTYVSARTTIEKQDKLIASKLKDIRSEAGNLSAELVNITLPHEEKQQEEVKRYEAEKEAERVAKEKAEQIRKEAIENKIQEFYLTQKGEIDTLTFETSEVFKTVFQDTLDKTDVTQFEEFELQFASKVQILKQQLDDKIQVLTDKENQRIEAEKLAKEKAEFEATKKAQEEADKKQRAESEAKQKEIDEANAKKEAELNAKQKAIDEAEAKQKAEKEAKEKAERLAKEKAKFEAAEKEKAEAEAKRKEELKPTIEKLNEWVESFEISICPIDENNEVVSVINKEFQAFKQFAKNKVSNIN